MSINHEFEESETCAQFMTYCTLVSLLSDKKINTANVFLNFLKNKHIRLILKTKMDIDSDFEAVNLFLKFDPALYKSKYVMKYLNNAGKFKIK